MNFAIIYCCGLQSELYIRFYLVDGEAEPMGADFFLCLFFSEKGPERNICLCLIGK